MLRVENEDWILAFDQIATVRIAALDTFIASAKDQRPAFIAAIDKVFTGY